MLLQAAIGGSGLALAGCVLSAAARRDGELVQLFELTIPAAKPYVLACDPRKRMRAEVRQFIEWIAEVAAAEPAGSTDAQPFANTVSARAITRSPQ